MKYTLVLILLMVLLLGLTACFNSKFYEPGKLGAGRQLRSPLEPPVQDGAKEHYWNVEEDISLFYFSHGEGRPLLVIHGGPGIPSSEPWRALELAGGYRFYYYHQRGCGESTHPVERFVSKNYYQNMVKLNSLLGMSAQLADLERIRRILKQDKIILVGHSYGGFLAALYALEFPAKVEKMVLVSPAGVLKLPTDYGGMDRVKMYLPEAMKQEYDDFLRRYFDYGKIFSKTEVELSNLNSEYGRFFMAALEAKGVKVPKVAQSLEGSGGWMVHALYFSLGRKYDYRDKLKRIKAKTLVIHGNRDVYPQEVSKEYADLIPRAELKVIPQAGHFAYDEQPEAFSTLVGDFLND